MNAAQQVAGTAARVRRPSRRIRVTDALLLAGSLICLLAGWEALVRVLHISPILLPAPSKVFGSLWAMLSSGSIVNNFKITLIETLAGFAIGSSVGIVLGALIAHSRMLDRLLYPYIVAFQALPKVAFAPLMVIWLGFGIESKVMMSVLVSFFPLLVNTIAGMRSVPQDYVDLMSALAADNWQSFRWVRFPSALPFIFAGLEVGIVLSIIGAIVGEFVGSSVGLGHLIMMANGRMDLATVFAVLVVLGLMGTLLQYGVTAARRQIVFWSEADQNRYRGA